MVKSFEEKQRKTAERLGLVPEQMPRHIAIIMDGNGRWAEEQSLPRAQGHRQGGKVVERIATHCAALGIESLTLYSFSIENWKRPKHEIDMLMHLYSQYLIAIRPMLMKRNVRMVHLGRMAELPTPVQTELINTIKLTATNTGMILALALNYGGRTEIVDATRKIAQEYKNGKLRLEDIDEQCVSQHLYTAGMAEPDLLIRTASEMRISNFLLWQISYSEFYVTKVLWPDFKNTDMETALRVYTQRNRRFGSVR